MEIENSCNDTLYQCMKSYNHGPNSRMSITFNSSKGLTNAPGQNNCFLNSAVQVLWHLDAFRRSFRQLSGHSCMGNSCIFCALKVMFTQFQYSDKQVLPPDMLRKAMADTFANEQRFQLGLMDDAAECFENMLMRIHKHIAPDESEDNCTAPHCIPHQKFTMSVTEQVVCQCGGRADPFNFNEMVFYVSTGALVNESKAQMAAGSNGFSFSTLLKSTVANGDRRPCPKNCGQQAEKFRHLQNVPDVVSIGLVWESAKSGSQHIRDVVNCIGQTLNLQEMFHSTGETNNKLTSEPLHLVGVVCYYGKHYSTFFLHSKVHEWIYFDDAAVKQVSPQWNKVVEKLCKGRHQPLLLLYMNPNTDCVDVSSAMNANIMAPGSQFRTSSSPTKMEPIRSKTPVPQRSANEVDMAPRKARTPAPDNHHQNGYTQQSGHHPVTRQTSRPDGHLSRQSSANGHISRHADDTISHASLLTKHSSDSNSSGPKVLRQASDAGSYSSMASTQSSSMVDSDDYVMYTYKNSTQRPLEPGRESSREPMKPSALKKKKQKPKTPIEAARLQSKSQMNLNTTNCYDDSSLPRNSGTDKGKSYATLPRKIKLSPATSPTKEPSEIHSTSWMKEIAKRSDEMRKDPVPAVRPIPEPRQMNGHAETNGVSKPPENMKPLLPMKTRQGTADGPNYISRSNVEKILSQQKRVNKLPSKPLLKPSHDHFTPPDEYRTENNKGGQLKFEIADNTSLNSLKDSGYKSCGGPGSTSASSVSSMSIESPTHNTSFTFDKEPIYSEPPVYNSQDDEEDFPPPPSEFELNGAHCKQLSEASVLSEASTVKHRGKTPSVESLDGANRTITDSFNHLCVSDKKLIGRYKEAEDMMKQSHEREETDLNTASIFCHQAVSILSAILAQRPVDKHFERQVEDKHEHCMQRTKYIHSRIIQEKEAQTKRQTHREPSPKPAQERRATQAGRPTPAVRNFSGEYIPLSAISHTEGFKRQSSRSSNHSNGSHDKVTIIDATSSGYGSRQTSNSSNESENHYNQPTQMRYNDMRFTQPQPTHTARVVNEVPKSESPTPSVIPPPKEFREESAPQSHSRSRYQPQTTQAAHNAHNGYVDRNANVSRQLPKPDNKSNPYSYPPVNTDYRQPAQRPAQQYQNQSQSYGQRSTGQPCRPTNHTQPTQPVSLPPKQSINKRDIRELLIQDMKHRTGQMERPSQPHNHTNYHNPPTNSQIPYQPRSTNYQNGYQPQNQLTDYDQYTETPLWTAPASSAYSQGYSHYDKPTHQYSQYGRVNHQQARVPDSKPPPVYKHSHTYSTEL